MKRALRPFDSVGGVQTLYDTALRPSPRCLTRSPRVSTWMFPFHPGRCMPWVEAYWADDPRFANPGDGNKVSTWSSTGSGAHAITQGTSANQPTFRSASSSMNGRASVDFGTAGTPVIWLANSSVSVAQPDTIIAIFNYTATVTAWNTLFDGVATRQGTGRNNATTVQYMLGATQINGAAGTYALGLQADRFYFNGASSVCFKNGASIISGNAGGVTLGGLTIGSNNSQATITAFTGQVGFFAVYKGNVTLDPEWPRLIRWAYAMYGVTLG